MPVLTWATHHRFWALGIGAAVLIAAIAAVAAGVWLFVLRSPGTQVDLRQALRLYRNDQRDPAPMRARLLPPPGVYDYRSSGYERLSVGGIGRSFPASSEMIVTAASCTTVRWVPFEQHVEGLVECPGRNGAVGMASALSDEEIAGVRSTEAIRCPRGAYFVPPRPTAGERWTATCHADGHDVAFSGRVIGWSSITVGGRTRPALHTRLTLAFTGSEVGTNPTDYWLSPSDGLILHEQEEVDVSQRTGPLGSVRYREEMTAAITSLAAAQ
jgi:hypothetical protein